jgi:bla regulator protein BlaR1
MQLLFMDQWLAGNFVQAICWTLVHSLWQGLILAAVAGILVMLTRKSVAALRYNLLATLFFVFMAVVVFTFVYELRITVSPDTIASLTQTPAVPVVNPLSQPDNIVVQVYHEEGFVTRFTGYFNQHASLIVTIWFIIFMAKAMKLMGGLAYIQRIRNHKVYAPTARWTARLEELAGKLGVPVPVRLLESGLVKVPLVAGFLKPIILVPVGLIANLPADQVEAILLHELAHIRRRDFIVNLAQSFAEILFFFNPAVLWLSSLLREEREHCCDDMAIAVTQSKKEYIEALVSFQEYQLDNTGHFAMAFPGKKNQLLNRVKRIIGNSNKSLNKAEKSFLALCLCIMCILSVVVSQTKQPEKLVKEIDTAKQEQDQSTGTKQDTIPGKKNNINTITRELKEPDEPTTGQEKMDSATSYSNDSSRAPYRYHYDSSSYKPIYDSARSALYKPYKTVYQPYQYGNPDTIPVFHNRSTVISGAITTTKDGKQYKILVDKNKTIGLAVDGKRVPDDKLAEYYPVIRSIFDEMAIEAEKSYNDKVKESEDNTRKLELQNYGLKLQLSHEGHNLAEPKINLSETKVNLSDLKVKVGTPPRLENKSELRQPISPLKPINFEVNRKTTLKKAIQPDRSPAEDIVDDLVKDGLVKETNPLTFKLNKDEFIVNEVIQPEPVRRRFQDKYVKHVSDSYLYSKNGGTTSTSIIRDK